MNSSMSQTLPGSIPPARCPRLARLGRVEAAMAWAQEGDGAAGAGAGRSVASHMCPRAAPGAFQGAVSMNHGLAGKGGTRAMGRRGAGLCREQPQGARCGLRMGLGGHTAPNPAGRAALSGALSPSCVPQAARRDARGRVRIARPRFPAPGPAGRDFLSRAGMRRLPQHRRLRVPEPSPQLRNSELHLLCPSQSGGWP